MARFRSSIRPETPLSGFLAYTPAFGGGARVAVGDLNGDGTTPFEIVTAPGRGGGPHIAGFPSTGPPAFTNFFAYE